MDRALGGGWLQPSPPVPKAGKLPGPSLGAR
jgi:hypothetical protein